jgi:DNA helicase-2/ATP-dependent DNA helicase PcrA
VGDDDQSIYSFRGGSPRYIRAFEEHYGASAKLGKLSRSWRCPRHILLGARAMVEQYHSNRIAKPEIVFSSDVDVSKKIVFHDLPSETFEAYKIAEIAEKAVKEMRSTILIIPNSNYFPPLREALNRRGLTFSYKTEPRRDGLVRFSVLASWVERKEDSVLFRYLLELIVNNNDPEVKKLPLASSQIRQLRVEASKRIAQLWDDVSPTRTLYDVFCARAGDAGKYPLENRLKTECLEPIEEAVAGKDAGKRKGLPEFLRLCGLMVAPGRNPAGFLRDIEEWRLDKEGTGTGGSYLPIEIYNMPSSKGLEARVVCVTGLSERIFPAPGDDDEEKARLLYVAMTRAEEELHLFSCRSRPASRTYATASYQFSPTPFLGAIPNRHLEKDVVYLRRKVKKRTT